MIVFAIGLAFVVAARLGPGEGAVATAIAEPTSVAAAPAPVRTRPPTPRPTPSPSPKPTPSPSPTRTWSPVVPTLGPDLPSGLRPPLPAIDIEGADLTVVADITRSIAALAKLDTYHFVAGVSGRSMLDLASKDGVYFAVRGDTSRAHSRSLDVLLSFQSVEFDGGAGISSTGHFVMIGDRSWFVEPNKSPAPIPPESSMRVVIDILLPAGVAERTVIPLAGGYERVGPEHHAGIATIHYQATDAGLATYAAVTGLQGVLSADLWIAEADGYLAAVEIRGKSASGEDGFLTQIDITHANDPKIVIKVPHTEHRDAGRSGPLGPRPPVRTDALEPRVSRTEPLDGRDEPGAPFGLQQWQDGPEGFVVLRVSAHRIEYQRDLRADVADAIGSLEDGLVQGHSDLVVTGEDPRLTVVRRHRQVHQPRACAVTADPQLSAALHQVVGPLEGTERAAQVGPDAEVGREALEDDRRSARKNPTSMSSWTRGCPVNASTAHPPTIQHDPPRPANSAATPGGVSGAQGPYQR
jgi:hypothetical protein